jgi:hypothetical protein
MSNYMKDTDTTIPPALTPEEWRRALANEFDRQAMLARSCDPQSGNDHARAALSLYGQSFGFTHEDIETLGRHIDLSRDQYADPKLLSLVDRLAALLPPTR